MHKILANYSVSISELKKNPSAILHEAGGLPVAVLNHNKPAAYLISAETYEVFMGVMEDYELAKLVDARINDREQAIEVSIDDL